MISKKLRSTFLLLSAPFCFLSFSLVAPSPTPAAEIIQDTIEGVIIEEVPAEDEDWWYIPGVRKYRCELIADMPSRDGGDVKTCAYNCRGYGGAATFPWPSSLPCPEGYNELMPSWPDGYPGSPYPIERRPSIYAD